MADKLPKKGKRRVRNPETFRERALKAAETTERPQRAKPLIKGTKAAGSVFKPLGRALGKLYNAKAFKPVRKVLSIIGDILFVGYFRRSWQELRDVTWPNWQQSRRLTFAVLVFAVVFGAVIAGVDWVLDKAFKDLLLK